MPLSVRLSPASCLEAGSSHRAWATGAPGLPGNSFATVGFQHTTKVSNISHSALQSFCSAAVVCLVNGKLLK